MIWRFYLTYNAVTTEVQEPIGWDKIAFSLNRGEKFGAFFEFTGSVKFYGEAYDIIKDAFDTDFYQADIDFEAQYTCNGSTYTTFFEGKLNISEPAVKFEYGIAGKTADVLLEALNPVKLLKANETKKYSLSGLTKRNLRLHSRAYNYLATYKIIETELLTQAHPELGILGGDTVVGVYGVYEGDQRVIEKTVILNPESGTWQFRIDYAVATRYRLIFYYGTDAASGSATAHIRNITTNTNIQNFTVTAVGTTPNTSINAKTFKYKLELTLDVTTGYLLNNEYAVWVEITELAIVGDSNYIFDVASEPNNRVEFVVVGSEPVVYTSGYWIDEVLDSVIQQASNGTLQLASDYYSRNDGCGSNRMLLNGYFVRGRTDKEVFTSFKELIDAIEAIDNIGFDLEESGGSFYLRVEPKSYFLDAASAPVLTMYNVSMIGETLAREYIWNSFEIGYSNWETNDANGNLEINTSRFYDFENVNKILSPLKKECALITGTYRIELQKRLKFRPTEDSSDDDKLFLICIASFTATTYPAFGDYFDSETNQNFDVTTNVFSPSTVYNLRLTPRRIAENWNSFIRGSMYNIGSAIQFVEGKGDSNNVTISENSNLGLSDCVLSPSDSLAEDGNLKSVDPLFIPVYVEFDYLITFEQFEAIRNGLKKVIEYSCNDGSLQKAYIQKLDFEPLGNEKGKATFKVLKLYA